MAVTAAPTTRHTRTERGISLARGPALILGTTLLVGGLYFLYRQHGFTPWSNFTNGSAPVQGKVLGIFGANGWTGMLTAVAGGLLLFGAAEHLLARTMSLIVGAALLAAAIISLISGNVLGMAAANHWTELAWAVAGAILLLNAVLARRRRTVIVESAIERDVVERPARGTVARDSAYGGGADDPAYGTRRVDPAYGGGAAASDEPAGSDEPVATQADSAGLV